MPPEWARHTRTWMEFPRDCTTFGDDPDGRARLLSHLRETAAERLAVSNPSYR